jgi:GH24 family phage-related lysozyme (muramidase)
LYASIVDREGQIPGCYLDNLGKWTCGIGHLEKSGDLDNYDIKVNGMRKREDYTTPLTELLKPSQYGKTGRWTMIMLHRMAILLL